MIAVLRSFINLWVGLAWGVCSFFLGWMGFIFSTSFLLIMVVFAVIYELRQRRRALGLFGFLWDVAGSFIRVFKPVRVPDLDALAEKAGFHLEHHEIETEDGFLCSLLHLVSKQPDKLAAVERGVVLMQHGLFQTCLPFMLNEGDQSLAFYLGKRGFDVWLGNNRGNIFSRKHKRMHSSDNLFWDWSIDDHAKDVRAFLRYIYRFTGGRRINYVGHSNGCAQALALFVNPNQHREALAADRERERDRKDPYDISGLDEKVMSDSSCQSLVNHFVAMSPGIFINQFESVPLRVLARLQSGEAPASVLLSPTFASPFSPLRTAAHAAQNAAQRHHFQQFQSPQHSSSSSSSIPPQQQVHGFVRVLPTEEKAAEVGWFQWLKTWVYGLVSGVLDSVCALAPVRYVLDSRLFAMAASVAHTALQLAAPVVSWLTSVYHGVAARCWSASAWVLDTLGWLWSSYVQPWIPNRHLLGHEAHFLFFGTGPFISFMEVTRKLVGLRIFSYFSYCMFNYLFCWSSDLWDKSRLPLYFSQTPAGTSSKTVAHWLQQAAFRSLAVKHMRKNKRTPDSSPLPDKIEQAGFRMYDHGTDARNRKRYGRIDAPHYDLSHIRVPVSVFYGGQDRLLDYDRTIRSIPTCVYSQTVPHYQHMDNLMATDANDFVFAQVERVLSALTVDKLGEHIPAWSSIIHLDNILVPSQTSSPALPVAAPVSGLTSPVLAPNHGSRVHFLHSFVNGHTHVAAVSSIKFAQQQQQYLIESSADPKPSLSSPLMQGVNAVGAVTSGAVNVVSSGVSSGVNAVGAVTSGAVNAVSSGVNAVSSGVQGVTMGVSDLASRLISTTTTTISNVANKALDLTTTTTTTISKPGRPAAIITTTTTQSADDQAQLLTAPVLVSVSSRGPATTGSPSREVDQRPPVDSDVTEDAAVGSQIEGVPNATAKDDDTDIAASSASKLKSRSKRKKSRAATPAAGGK